MNLINSLALRLFLSASVWILLTLFSGGLLLSDIFRESTEKSFNDKLNLFMESLIGSSKIDSTNSITVVNSLGDPRFFQPYSGWYWQINEGSKTLVRSRSMWDQVLTLDKRLIGGRAQFINTNKNNKNVKEFVQSQKLIILQREISFPGFDEPLTFMVSGDTQEFEKNISLYNNILISSLVVLGLGLLLSVFLQVKYGLLPLKKIKNSLFKIRNGDATKLEENYPIEVSPLAREINILLEHNEKIVERAKTHVGNLAHALKTPLAVISNQLDKNKKGVGEKIMVPQVEMIKTYVDKYLNKARTSSKTKIVSKKIDVEVTTKKIIKVFQKINPQITINYKFEGKKLMFLGDSDDLNEILGNVLENACKWTKNLVNVNISKSSENKIKFIISDNGPGLSEIERKKVFARGFRLDEQTPGTGLGLNIVKDTVDIYSGKVWMSESKFKGLSVNIELPCVI
ncbi:MAG: hypothetical protein CMM91_09300 [Rickettsiales bacterium]|nr:hypothetical protein [Rickettsiales bacterium]OUV53231.1 MAG: hypothetical protein CBC87_05015 [Rickettsiales bacterium TMED127]